MEILLLKRPSARACSKLAWSQGFILDGWPATVSEASALERGLTGLDLQREEAILALSPRLAPPLRGWLPDPLRTLTSGGHYVARYMVQRMEVQDNNTVLTLP